MSIETLMAERERLDEIINAASQAKAAKTQINKLIALYSQMTPDKDKVVGLWACDEPGCTRSFTRAQALGMHKKSHSKVTVRRRKVAK
jgi:hypothetical protein